MHDWPILEQLWQRHCDPDHHGSAHDAALWRRQVQALYAHNIAHPVALQFLLQQRPTREAFYNWILQSEADYHLLDSAQVELNAEADFTLSPAELAFWQENGYLVLRGVIDAAACRDSCDVVWQYLAASPDDPASWYAAVGRQQGLMLPLYNQPRLNTNRASRRVQSAYQQLYGPRAIYKTIDHLSFNPPETDQFTFRGDGLHWDVSLALPIPERYQGLLYLTDCKAGDGAFHCVPGFQHRIGDWLAGLPADADARAIAAQTLVPQPVPGQAGDFVIWHQALPHCATPNRGRTPRIVQYLSYVPVDEEEQALWR